MIAAYLRLLRAECREVETRFSEWLTDLFEASKRRKYLREGTS